ncbi:hypothetical protein [Flavobacterium xinjiangense]|jgi:hypothetical protein|uniref:Protein required for attachment to host cells n=1 Tax=Flavobacterium xinjiangense TaxID=178356 RepID=A0A1M7F566_9FLAO|nr:hypothetical protein [Flavobacterium xinjiangense]SHL98797.1 hypothetical protein SAMN05216269_10229 [Flavobacterium xinjiangense]
MKRQTGIWIDTSKAIIVTLEGGKDEKISEIDSDVENSVYHDKEGNKGTFSGGHHGNSESKFENRKKEQLDFFIKEVLSYVKGADELFVFGPAETKIRLEQKIQDEKLFTNKLKAVETADKMTLNEIVAKVKKFYVS